MVPVAKMGTDLHFTPMTSSADKQQIKQHMFPSACTCTPTTRCFRNLLYLFMSAVLLKVNFQQAEIHHKDKGS